MNDILHDVSWVVPFRNEYLTLFFESLSWLGYPTFVMILLPLGYWLWNKNAITRVAVLVILSTILNAFLKDLWQNPRPDISFALDPEVGKSFGMPSGHAQIAVVLWFGLAFEIRRRWAWRLATFLVVGIACSRIYLGVHDLEDIIVGLSIGFASLYLYRWLLRPRNLPLRNKPVWAYVFILIALQVIAYQAWPKPGHLLMVLSLVPFLIAWLIGHTIEKNRVEFEIKPQWWAYLIVAVLGIVGMGALSKLNQFIFANFDQIINYYGNTFILAIYMTLLAPAVFSLLGLSRRAR